jgi:hypothetical protein
MCWDGTRLQAGRRQPIDSKPLCSGIRDAVEMGMTIYIHFKTSAQSVRLFNVSSVEDAGVDAIKVRMMFADDGTVYAQVSHVAMQPEKE